MREDRILKRTQRCLKAHERGEDREFPPPAPGYENREQGGFAEKISYPQCPVKSRQVHSTSPVLFSQLSGANHKENYLASKL
jgi:hypothetical protein